MSKLAETKFLFEKIQKLYPTFEMPDEFDVECWTEVLQGHSQEDILKALKAYRKTVEYNQAPTPGTFAKFLREERDWEKETTPVAITFEDDEKKTSAYFWDRDPALAYYLRDCETKPSDQVHGLIFYRRVLKDIITLNVETLPKGREMSFAEKVNIIRRNGWDADITQQVNDLVMFEVGTVKGNPVKTLGSHWRVSSDFEN